MKYSYTLCTVLVVLSILINVSGGLPEAAAQNVNVPDANLAAVLRDLLEIDATAPISQADMARLQALLASDAGITDLTGLEHATNLWWLHVSHNRIRDLRPLSGLTKLRNLRMDNNQISDLRPLAGLTNLERLNLTSNQISDLRPLAGLTNLIVLVLLDNQISDISPVAGLTNLLAISFGLNQVSDISPVAGLTNLMSLVIRDNQIRDISPVTGLTKLTSLGLNNNQVSDISPVAGLTKLTLLYMSENQISDIRPIAELTNLEKLDIAENQISDISILTSLTKLTELRLGDNQISDLSPLLALTNLTDLTIGDQRLQKPRIVLRPSPIAQDRVIFNEVRNAEDDNNDWLELKNISDEPVSLKDWEISIVTPSEIKIVNKAEDAGKDEDIVAFPDYTLPAGGVLLVTNTDPSETQLGPGQDITDAAQNAEVPSQYFIASEMRLPDTPYLLILRSATDKNGTPESVEDIVGNYFRESVYYGTQIWPLRHTVRPANRAAAVLTQGQAWRRITIEARGYIREAWGLSGYQSGIGYKSDASVDTSLGTPGYPNDTVTDPGIVGRVTISEVMFATEGGLLSQAQWIELYNNTPYAAMPVNLKGWKLAIEARDSDGRHRYSVIALEALDIATAETVLLVSRDRPKSGHISESQIYELAQHDADARKLDWRENRVIGQHGFGIRLYSPDGTLVDVAGNLDGKRGKDTPKWELPSGRTQAGVRTSLIREYADNLPLDGREAASWVRAADITLPVNGYYGHKTDISTAGYGAGGPEPVVTSISDDGPTGPITISEVMFATEGGLLSTQAQWIELHNNTTDTEASVNLKGWKLIIEARDPDARHRYSVLELKALDFASGQTVLLVSQNRPKSEHISDAQIYELSQHSMDAPKLRQRENQVLGWHGFGLRLYSPDGTLVDIAGNLDGKRGKDTPAWELPSGRTEAGFRTSLIRQYEDNIPLGGTKAASWVRAADIALPVNGYYGHKTDISTAGYSSNPDPVDTSILDDGLTGLITISEVMFVAEGGLLSRQAQWIELYNNTTDTEASVNLKGWKLMIEARDSDAHHRYSVLELKALEIAAGQTVLLVSRNRPKSEHIAEAQIYELSQHNMDAPKLRQRENQVIGSHGFSLRLYSPDGTLVDVAGNLDGKRGKDTPKWELPSGRLETGIRTSLIRRYEEKIALDGTERASWIRAADTALSVNGYYGHRTDLGTPGYRGGGTLPVALSSFRATRMESGVVIEWTTVSELNNAGFNILRSQTRKGAFVKVNPTLIVGAGTTSEANTYTWRDTTAQATVAYYYRLEDVSLDGTHQVSVAVRMRGHLSASGKSLQRWGDLKKEQ